MTQSSSREEGDEGAEAGTRPQATARWMPGLPLAASDVAVAVFLETSLSKIGAWNRKLHL